MNEKNTLESLFGQLGGSFDLETPVPGHRERFRLKMEQSASRGAGGGQRSWWRPLSIAASVALLIGASVFMLRPVPTVEQQVAKISPEVSETSTYFAGVVEQQVRLLEELSSPETKPLIDDTIRQLGLLEADYRKMEADLIGGGNSKLILSAMITNFQTRIDLLQDVMLKVEEIKQFKDESNESNAL